MKIGFFGDGPWAERALLPLVQDPLHHRLCRGSRLAARPRTDRIAKSHGIPLLCPASVNSDESLAESHVRRRSACLDVYDQILRAQFWASRRAAR